MGELINNMDIFKKLDFDTSNQWIFYDERFHKFFDFFANNVTDANILTETQVMECDEYTNRQQFLDTKERKIQLEELEKEYPGLLTNTDSDIDDLTQELMTKEEEFKAYNGLLEDMRSTKNTLNCDFCKQEKQLNLLNNKEREMYTLCLNESKKLEDAQRENLMRSNEVTKLFSKKQSPPLFMHQLPLDQYFLKCESFTQYFTLYIKENFKFHDCVDYEAFVEENKETGNKLETLRTCIEQYTMGLAIEKAKCRATQNAINGLEFNQIHVISLSDIERETHELELVNSHQEIANQTLKVDLHCQIQQQAQHTIEMILYENTKQKLDRALRRHESDKRLAIIVSAALSNAELIWIIIQMDLEKMRKRFSNSAQLSTESQQCLQRIQLMKNAKFLNSTGICMDFIGSFAKQLSNNLKQPIRPEIKGCLYEYEKFKRLLDYALQGLLNRKPYGLALEKLKEINRLETILRPFVYDSPVKAPMFENVVHLKPIFNVKYRQESIEKQLRHLRTQFHENIKERSEKDKLWRYSQLLWIWFLTEPRRVLQAIEEAKKAAAKMPQFTGIKSLGGIKRK